MSRPKNREEFRREMAQAFADVLEEDGLHWKKEWHSFGAPRNGVTKAPYKGCNAFWLSLVSLTRGYSDPRWVTMTQIMDRGAVYHPKEKWHLRAGTKAVYVEYWFPYDQKERKTVPWETYYRDLQNGRSPSQYRLLAKYTPVFNAGEVDGIPEREAVRGEDVGMEELVRKLSENMNVPIRLDGGDQAYYAPYEDCVHLPEPGAFENEYAFNATALHELTHSTGHPSRLDRPLTAMRWSEAYAYEELVAEISSCFMGCALSQGPDRGHLENHRAYVQSWIREIRDQPETLIRAIRDAQGAADYMDRMAGLITEQEYETLRGRTAEIREREKERELLV